MKQFAPCCNSYIFVKHLSSPYQAMRIGVSLTHSPEYQKVSSTHQGLSTYQVWRFWDKALIAQGERDRHTN